MRKRKRELIALYEEESSLLATQEDSKKKKMDEDIPQPEEWAAFFRLLEDEHIKLFLARDSSLKISDKYLLAMVLTYCRRARLRVEEYSTYFFPCLFLANQFEEDVPFRKEIYKWALAWKWTMTKRRLQHFRNLLLLRMGFRAWVDQATCDLIMAQDSGHWAWKRERAVHHSRAVRWFRRDDEEFSTKDPWSSPVCNTILHPCKEEEAEKIHCPADTEEQPGAADS